MIQTLGVSMYIFLCSSALTVSASKWSIDRVVGIYWYPICLPVPGIHPRFISKNGLSCIPVHAQIT